MNPTQLKVCKQLTNWFLFKLYSLRNLPLSTTAGIRIIELNELKCVTRVKYKWLVKNPFRSTYWAVLGMAAELSTGAYAVLATKGIKENISVILVSTKAEFLKKATDVSTFTCDTWHVFNEAANKAIETNEVQTATGTAIGINKAGENIANFEFTWSFKKR